MKNTVGIGRKFITLFSVLSILAVSAFSVLIGVDFFAAAETTPSNAEIWNGYDSSKVAVPFSGGDGSAADPYIITTADQLFRMVYDFGKSANNQATYYKLANDIYLNDITDYDKWGSKDFDMSSLNNWYENEAHFEYPAQFLGSFDGDGHFIYGLYACGYRFAAFLPESGKDSVVKNVHFRNSYTVNTAKIDPKDQEGDDGGNGVYSGNRTWYDSRYGSASVIVGCCENAISISNCSVKTAYVEASYFTSAIIAVANSCYPTVKNCLVADVTLNATSKEKGACGIAGGVINLPYGSKDAAQIDSVIVADLQVYGASDRDALWNGLKVPTAAYAYKFNSVYSNVKHTYSVDHYQHGKLNYEDDEVTVVKSGYLKGTKAKQELDLDWEHNWKVVENDYPIPQNEYIVPTGEEYYKNGGPASSENVWDGTTAKNFAAGTGTAEDPYLIDSCAQFYKMVSTLNADKFYKIADGVTALYFNDIKGLSYSETVNALKSRKMLNYTPGDTNNFSGYFDGNGVTIYGVKSDTTNCSGLFPQAGSSTIKNFTIKNSVFNTTNKDAEGSAAVVADLSTSATVNLRNIAVVDCSVHSTKNAAGMVACSHLSGCVFIDDSIVSGGEIASELGSTNHAGFIASSLGSEHTIKNCISLGVYAAADNDKSYTSVFKNVYTDQDAPSAVVSENISGVKTVSTESLKGETVKSTAPEFDWNGTWTTTSDIPMPLKHTSVIGTPGKAWSGKIADSYAGGNGTINNPFLIDTPERLAQMLSYCKSGSYYKLTADIYINDVNNPDWKDSALKWLDSNDVSGFTGILDANGYTVYGLYNTDVESGVYAGLIPLLGSGGEVRNIKVDSAYISGNSGSYIGAAIGGVEDNATNITSLRSAEIGKDVVLTGAANAGGVVGRIGFARLRMDNSIFKGSISATGKVGGLVGEVIGKLDIKESVSVGVYPFASAQNITASAIYTDAQGSVDGVIALEADNMKGANAKTYMTGLDFNNIWSENTGDYPSPTYKVRSFNGVQGEVWSGEIATGFAGGSGTADDPYQVATGEQLALAISNSYNSKSFILVADIYLNNVSDELWTAKVGCNQWYDNHTVSAAFTGTFDGDGYAVFGMYFNYKTTPQNTYIGLFPQIGGSAAIKNLGVSNAYIKAAIGDDSVYAGGFFGMGSGFYNFYGNKTTVADTVNDEFLVPGESTPRKLPSFTNCFVDHNSYIEANSVGGIGNPGGAVIVIRDCYVTATIKASENAKGALIGNQWSQGSRIYNSLALPQNDDVKPSAGTHQWSSSEADKCFEMTNVYYYGSTNVYAVTRLSRPQWRVGDAAKNAMQALDWENTWRVEADGTPVLRIFDKQGRGAGIFSDKTYNIPTVTINFLTGTTEVEVPSISGKPYEKVSLPTPTRPGYIFTGWYSFSDITLPYPYEYFLSRDINLYAGWKKNSIIQDFENYTYSMYDCDLDRWNYNRPGSRGGYDIKYAYRGTKSIHLLDNSSDPADLLINYDEWLTVGQTYKMTFWATTDKANNPNTTLSLVHNNYPDYVDTAIGVEPMVTLTGLTVGEWKQYSYSFTALTNWVSIRATGNSSLYFDDVLIMPTGDIIENTNYVGGDSSGTSPNTGVGTGAAILVAAIISCAVIMIISKKNSVEVIEKN